MIKVQSTLRGACVAALVLLSVGLQVRADDRVKSLPSETPEKFTPRTEILDYVRREAMIQISPS